jgi:hypothetical protein
MFKLLVVIRSVNGGVAMNTISFDTQDAAETAARMLTESSLWGRDSGYAVHVVSLYEVEK